MSRTYSFEHFTAQKPPAGRGTAREAKQGSRPQGLHYGQRYAETQHLLHQRPHPRQSPRPTSPIGSLPTMPPVEVPAPVSATPQDSLTQLWEEAQRSAGDLLHAAGEASAASARLGKLPWEAGKVLLHQLEGFFALSRS